MPAKATKTRKAKSKAPASFYYRGVKITPMTSLNSRFARAIRKGLEARQRAEGAADDAKSD